jgi:hypothetical protein
MKFENVDSLIRHCQKQCNSCPLKHHHLACGQAICTNRVLIERLQANNADIAGILGFCGYTIAEVA